jgi:hypothetical protein
MKRRSLLIVVRNEQNRHRSGGAIGSRELARYALSGKDSKLQ